MIHDTALRCALDALAEVRAWAARIDDYPGDSDGARLSRAWCAAWATTYYIKARDLLRIALETT